jgi:hypothetical protein
LEYSKLQHYGTCKFSWKTSKTLYSNQSSHIEDDIMQSHEEKKIEKKEVKIQDSMDKTNFFLAPCPLVLRQF